MITSVAQLESMTEEDLLLERLEEGAGEPCLFLPFVGEFGHEVMSHLRIVHWNKASEKTVCCRPGNEVLYPSADRFVTDWRDPVPDALRVATMRARRNAWPGIVDRFPGHRPLRVGGLSPTQELIPIRPGERVPFRPRLRGLRVDVVLGVRRRAFAPERNWPHWQQVADSLRALGLTFAVMGHRSTSFDLHGQALHTGDLDTDAALELLTGCQLYIGSDSGGSHLAAAAGARMLVFREEASNARDLRPLMSDVNPGRMTTVDHVWDEPRRVIVKAIEMLGGPRCR